MINSKDYIKQELKLGNVKIACACEKSAIEEFKKLQQLDSNYNIEEKMRKHQKVIIKLREDVALTDSRGVVKELDKGDIVIVSQNGEISSIMKENYPILYTERDVSILEKFKEAKKVLDLETPIEELLKNNGYETKELSVEDASLLKAALKSEKDIECLIAHNKDNTRALVCIEKKDKERVESLIEEILSYSKEDKEAILRAEKDKSPQAKVVVKELCEKYGEEKVLEQAQDLDKDLHIMTADELRALKAANIGYDIEKIVSQIRDEIQETQENHGVYNGYVTNDVLGSFEEDEILENPEDVNGRDIEILELEDKEEKSAIDSINDYIAANGGYDEPERTLFGNDSDY
jgi:hypothetical protein